jgi:uncharacterized protein
MEFDATYFIRELNLTQHVEGGWYRESYRSEIRIGQKGLPPTFRGERNASTSIYFLLENDAFSAFHRIKSDETWHFYAGNGLTIYELLKDRTLKEHHLGADPGRGQLFQTVVKAGNWFASRIEQGRGFALCGCTVSPGFDFADFELAGKESLIAQYPQHENIIKSLCR